MRGLLSRLIGQSNSGFQMNVDAATKTFYILVTLIKTCQNMHT